MVPAESLLGKALARRLLGFGVPPLGGSGATPPEGGTPNQDFQTGSEHKKSRRMVGLFLDQWILFFGSIASLPCSSPISTLSSQLSGFCFLLPAPCSFPISTFPR